MELKRGDRIRCKATGRTYRVVERIDGPMVEVYRIDKRGFKHGYTLPAEDIERFWEMER